MSAGTVYLVHLDGGLPMDTRRTARHYVGWAREVHARRRGNAQEHER